MSPHQCGPLGPFPRVSHSSHAVKALYETYHVGQNNWLSLVPMSFSPTRQRVRNARLSLPLPSSHCPDVNQAAWYLGKALQWDKTWTPTPNPKSSCQVIQGRHSKLLCLSVFSVHVEKVRSHRAVMKEQVIWKQCSPETRVWDTLRGFFPRIEELLFKECLVRAMFCSIVTLVCLLVWAP